MDCVVCVLGDSLTSAVIHFMYRALGVSNAEINANTLGSFAGLPRPFWRRIHTSGSGNTICCNYGWDGTNLDQFMDTGDATRVAWRNEVFALFANRGANRRHILFIGFGTNMGPITPSTFLALLSTLVADAKAAGADDVIIRTIPSRTDATWGGALGTKNTDFAAPINATLRDTSPGNWAETNGVYICDIATHTEIGPWDLIGNVLAIPSSNPLNFYDTVHPTRATVEIALPTIQAAINARIIDVGGTVIPTTA